MAEYVETLLAPGETIVTNARQHWAALIRFALQPIVILLLALLGLGLGMWMTGTGWLSGIIQTLLGLATLVLFVVAVVWLPIQFIRWRTRRFVLTNRRVIRSEGLMRRSSNDAGLDKITDVGYKQSFLGARLGFGDLRIATTAGNPLQFDELIEANEFKKAIMVAQEQLIKDRARTLIEAQVAQEAQVAAPPEETRATTPEEITAILARLTDMRDAGSITEADYEAKKQELLSRL